MQKLNTLLIILITTSTLNAQEWITPVIEGYGKIIDFKNVDARPDAALDYKLVFDITAEREMEGVNMGLWKIARVINMLEAADVPKEKIHLVAAIHGGATFATLGEAKYREKYEKQNPNDELLKLLNDYGVDILVCAQATAARNIAAEDLNSNTRLGLSAMMVLANYQLKGYVLMP
jgi:intracellular sulfur oxidation DsrE/DsrF family protein